MTTHAQKELLDHFRRLSADIEAIPDAEKRAILRIRQQRVATDLANRVRLAAKEKAR